MAREFNVDAARSSFELPPLTRQQIKALMSDLDADARSIIIMSIAELWQREIGEPDRDLAAEIDEIKAHLNMQQRPHAARKGTRMQVSWFQDPETVAVTDTDDAGRCVVLWTGQGDQGVRCYGWIEGGKLFVPADGDGVREDDFQSDGTPDPIARWYECETGKDAIIGIPGAVLAVFE